MNGYSCLSPLNISRSASRVPSSSRLMFVRSQPSGERMLSMVTPINTYIEAWSGLLPEEADECTLSTTKW